MGKTMSETIPIIDMRDYLAGREGALAAAARRVHDALTTVGFFVLTGHDVPLRLIERTFEEARRFHQLPMEKKLALKLNEHVNGYMTMGRYAVRTSASTTTIRVTSTKPSSSSASARPTIRSYCPAAALSAPTNGRPKAICRGSAPTCSNTTR